MKKRFRLITIKAGEVQDIRDFTCKDGRFFFKMLDLSLKENPNCQVDVEFLGEN